MSLTAAERETVIVLNDEDDTATIHTSQRPWITRLKRNPSATLVDEGKFEGSAWAEFEIPKSLIAFPRNQKRKGQPMSEGRKAKLAAARNGNVTVENHAPEKKTRTRRGSVGSREGDGS
jgi:hypothetical protein